ncbi:MAG: TatD family hydrolase [Candidatus Bathyarchaeota archaeon]|nr:TatD family hydrolase [Candidatus Bathyarchaeota archaeon]
MFSESHSHIREVNEEAIERAKKAGVELVLTAGIDVASSEQALEVAGRFDVVKGCVGIHPWYADEYSPENLEKLQELAGMDEVVAISEIGLDFAGRMTRERVRSSEVIDPDIQRAAFRDQIGLAKEMGLPVLVHDRAHGEEVLDILEDTGMVEVGAAVHGFSKGPEYARRAVGMGIYLSIGRNLLRGENEELAEAIRRTPMEWILTETDSGDPTGVLSVAEKIAELKGMTVDEVGLAATGNLKKLLRL